MKTRVHHMFPKQETDCAWSWPLLVVKQSIQTTVPCNGVFAKQQIKSRTMIPIVGIKLSQKDYDKKVLVMKSRNYDIDEFPQGTFSHGWDIKQYAINGISTLFTYRKVGSFGLAIAMMVNEPTYTKPNCIFKQNHLITVTNIEPGEELTVYYGSQYGNNYIIYSNMDVRDIGELPGTAIMNKHIATYQDIIDICFKKNGGWKEIIDSVEDSDNHIDTIIISSDDDI